MDYLVDGEPVLSPVDRETVLSPFSPTPTRRLQNCQRVRLKTCFCPRTKEQLTVILTYHVVAGKVTSAQVVTLESATTVNGQDVQIRVENDTVMVDGATVAVVDVMASNGVIHVIDEVILPN